MAKYVTKIRTIDGDLPIDYNALANKPKPDTSLSISGQPADAKAVGEAISNMNQAVEDAISDMYPAVEDLNHPGCYYRPLPSGLWEWINPPIKFDNNEFLTTEKRDGKSVWTRGIDGGLMLASGPTNVKLGTHSDFPYYPFREEIICYNNTSTKHGNECRTRLTCGYWFDGTWVTMAIQPPASGNVAGHKLQIRIWYTKD